MSHPMYLKSNFSLQLDDSILKRKKMAKNNAPKWVWCPIPGTT